MPDFLSVRKIESILKEASGRFSSHDLFLLSSKAHERTITHRIAVYLEQLLPDWNVDCEYNRQGVTPDPKSDLKGNRVFPDIIVHIRGTDKNLLVIEAKPSWARRTSKLADREKLLRILQVHHYRHAYLLHYSFGRRAKLQFKRVVPAVEIIRSARVEVEPLPLP